MARIEVNNKSMKDFIQESLTEEILEGEQPTGSRLPPIRKLADQFGTSVAPVHQALQNMEADGFIEKRRGAGTFVADTTPPFTLSESIAVAVGPQSAHVWGDLDRMLAERLHDDGAIPLMVNPHSKRGITALARSDVKGFIIHAGAKCPFDIYHSPLFEDKTILSLVSWAGPKPDGLLSVLTDYDKGARMAAHHLFNKGHKRVLLLDPPEHTIPSAEEVEAYQRDDSFDDGGIKTLAFMKEWEKLGGKWEAGQRGKWKGRIVRYNPKPLMEHFSAPDPCTAVFASMDVLAFSAQRILAYADSKLASDVDFVGYYDTPWSEAGHPAFTTLNLNLQELANRACHKLKRKLQDKPIEQKTEIVEPQLVKR